MKQNEAYQAIFCTFKTTSGFNSDHIIRQHAHCLLLESPFVPSSTDRWAVRAKIRQKRPSHGRSGETGSRNMAATHKINFLTLVSYSLLQTVFSYRFATIQNVTDRRQTTDRRQCMPKARLVVRSAKKLYAVPS